MLSVDNFGRTKKIQEVKNAYACNRICKKLLNVMDTKCHTSTVLMEKLTDKHCFDGKTRLKSKETFTQKLHESGYATSLQVGTNDNSRKTEK